MMEWMEEPVRWFDTPDPEALRACAPTPGGLEGTLTVLCEGERATTPVPVLVFQSAEVDAEEERSGECEREGEPRSREMRLVVCTLRPFSCRARRRSLTLDVAGSSPSSWFRSLL